MLYDVTQPATISLPLQIKRKKENTKLLKKKTNQKKTKTTRQETPR